MWPYYLWLKGESVHFTSRHLRSVEKIGNLARLCKALYNAMEFWWEGNKQNTNTAFSSYRLLLYCVRWWWLWCIGVRRFTGACWQQCLILRRGSLKCTSIHCSKIHHDFLYNSNVHILILLGASHWCSMNHSHEIQACIRLRMLKSADAWSNKRKTKTGTAC